MRARSTIRHTLLGFYPYGYARHSSSFEGGMRPGSYATPLERPIMNARAAQQGLASLRSEPPDAYYLVRPDPGTAIQGPRMVLPVVRFQGWRPILRLGLGREARFRFGTGRGTVSGPFAIPR